MSTVIDHPRHTTAPLDDRGRALRRTIVDVLEQAGRGHVASAFSLVEILRVLYDDVLNVDPRNPDAPERDRCILSKGHGCLALYAVLADKGFIPQAELGRFCAPDGLLGGHPEIQVPGVEASTGSLGHGLSIGIGMALSARLDQSSRRVHVIVGDGESNEGSVWEGALSAAKHGLDNLTVIVDYNKQQSYSTTYEVCDLEPFTDKWKSFGFAVTEVDGHDVESLRAVLQGLPLKAGRPSAVICHTIKGRGIDFVETNLDWHHKNKLSADELQRMRDALGG